MTAKSFGGDKFVDACHSCNSKKGHMSLDEFREFLGVDEFFGEIQKWEPW